MKIVLLHLVPGSRSFGGPTIHLSNPRVDGLRWFILMRARRAEGDT
jgi:hypothetical protein